MRVRHLIQTFVIHITLCNLDVPFEFRRDYMAFRHIPYYSSQSLLHYIMYLQTKKENVKHYVGRYLKFQNNSMYLRSNYPSSLI